MSPAARKLRGPQLYTPRDIERLSTAGALARSVLDDLLAMVIPGVYPYQLVNACTELFPRAACKAPMTGVRDAHGNRFGWPISIAIDDVVCHSRPRDVGPLANGQIVTIDLIVNHEPFCADVSDTVVVGGGGHPLLDALDAVWHAGLDAVRSGGAWTEVTRAMARTAGVNGVRLVRGLAGHGIGYAAHELPLLPLTPTPADPHVILRPGMVFTLEPAITTGSGETVDSEDGWAIRTADGAPAAAREAMIAVGNEQIRVLGGWCFGDSATGAGYNPLRTGLGSGE